MGKMLGTKIGLFPLPPFCIPIRATDALNAKKKRLIRITLLTQVFQSPTPRALFPLFFDLIFYFSRFYGFYVA